MKSRIIFILVILLLSCTSKKQQSDSNTTDSLTIHSVDTVEIIDTSKFEYEDYEKLESYISKVEINSSFEVIDFDCAILIYPTDWQIEEMKRENGEDDFYTIADDNQYYHGTAIGIIDSLGVKTTTASKRFLKLKGNNKFWVLDMRKKNLPAWNIIFFKRTKEPQIISAIDLTVEQTKNYFEIQ